MSEQQTIVKRDSRVNTFAKLIMEMKGELARALPRQIPIDRFLRVVLTTMRRTPKIAECTPESVLGSILQAAQDGLDIDGVHSALVPYRIRGTMTAQYQPMYRGLIALARRSGEVSTVRANEVYEGDRFEYELGLDPVLRHIPCGEEDEAKITHVYAVIALKDGGRQFEVMSRAQIERVRASSRAQRDDSPWNTHWPEMARKTVLRRALKLCPVSAEVQRTLTRDESLDFGVGEPVLSTELLPDATEAPTILAAPSDADLAARVRNGGPGVTVTVRGGPEQDAPAEAAGGEQDRGT